MLRSHTSWHRPAAHRSRPKCRPTKNASVSVLSSRPEGPPTLAQVSAARGPLPLPVTLLVALAKGSSALLAQVVGSAAGLQLISCIMFTGSQALLHSRVTMGVADARRGSAQTRPRAAEAAALIMRPSGLGGRGTVTSSLQLR